MSACSSQGAPSVQVGLTPNLYTVVPVDFGRLRTVPVGLSEGSDRKLAHGSEDLHPDIAKRALGVGKLSNASVYDLVERAAGQDCVRGCALCGRRGVHRNCGAF